MIRSLQDIGCRERDLRPTLAELLAGAVTIEPDVAAGPLFVLVEEGMWGHVPGDFHEARDIENILREGPELLLVHYVAVYMRFIEEESVIVGEGRFPVAERPSGN